VHQAAVDLAQRTGRFVVELNVQLAAAGGFEHPAEHAASRSVEPVHDTAPGFVQRLRDASSG